MLYDSSQLLLYGICFGFTSLLAIILFYSGAFGGADAKALMCLALALPFYPEGLFMPTLQGFSPISKFLFPISIFNNSVLLAAATALYMLLRNVFWHWKAHESLFENFKNESLGKKILVALTGYKASVGKLKEKWHLYPLEDIESLENGFKRKLIVMPQDEGRNETVERLDNAIKFGKINDAIWATPGLPMLIFITIGLVIALFLGDIVWIFLRLLMG
jgi:preflagellin peptidase FlaK